MNYDEIISVLKDVAADVLKKNIIGTFNDALAELGDAIDNDGPEEILMKACVILDIADNFCMHCVKVAADLDLLAEGKTAESTMKIIREKAAQHD